MTIRPIAGERFRYFVQSAPGKVEHLVDLLDHECGCADWTCRQRKWREEHKSGYTCKHIRIAREYELNQYLERERNK
jgi:hypothetical protein